MATGKGLICQLGDHIPIEGADKIVQVNMFGETVIVSNKTEAGTLGILFDMETCLSHEYASANNLYRNSKLNLNNEIKGYLEEDRRIRPIKLKGVKVSGLFMPINSLNSLDKKASVYLASEVGKEIDFLGKILICKKYISKDTRKAMSQQGGSKNIKANICPTFKEHVDTDQWSRNKNKMSQGSIMIITEKLHGTSGRCGNLLIEKKNSWWKNLLLTLVRGKKITHTLEYGFVVGSRRVLKSVGGCEDNTGYYNEDLWTKISKEYFEGKLNKGETVYFEIVGYTPSGELIMPSVSNEKLEKFLSKEEYKAFIERYGETTSFNYGCNKKGIEYEEDGWSLNTNPQYKVFVYRITMTNEDGDSIDYSWEQVKSRCEKLGVNYTPELDKGLICVHDITEKFYIRTETNVAVDPDYLVDKHTNSSSLSFPTHVREGVCIRIEDGKSTPTILKNKSFIFKVLEGIIKDSNQVDLEESN